MAQTRTLTAADFRRAELAARLAHANEQLAYWTDQVRALQLTLEQERRAKYVAPRTPKPATAHPWREYQQAKVTR